LQKHGSGGCCLTFEVELRIEEKIGRWGIHIQTKLGGNL